MLTNVQHRLIALGREVRARGFTDMAYSIVQGWMPVVIRVTGDADVNRIPLQVNTVLCVRIQKTAHVPDFGVLPNKIGIGIQGGTDVRNAGFRDDRLVRVHRAGDGSSHGRPQRVLDRVLGHLAHLRRVVLRIHPHVNTDHPRHRNHGEDCRGSRPFHQPNTSILFTKQRPLWVFASSTQTTMRLPSANAIWAESKLRAALDLLA